MQWNKKLKKRKKANWFLFKFIQLAYVNLKQIRIQLYPFICGHGNMFKNFFNFDFFMVFEWFNF